MLFKAHNAWPCNKIKLIHTGDSAIVCFWLCVHFGMFSLILDRPFLVVDNSLLYSIVLIMRKRPTNTEFRWQFDYTFSDDVGFYPLYDTLTYLPIHD